MGDGGECGRGTAGNGRERVLGVWTDRDGGECGRGTAGNGRERVLGAWTDRDGGECGRGTAGNGRERVLGAEMVGRAKMGQWRASMEECLMLTSCYVS